MSKAARYIGPCAPWSYWRSLSTMSKAARYIGPCRTVQIDARWLEPGEVVRDSSDVIEALIESFDFEPVKEARPPLPMVDEQTPLPRPMREDDD